MQRRLIELRRTRRPCMRRLRRRTGCCSFPMPRWLVSVFLPVVLCDPRLALLHPQDLQLLLV